MLLKKGHKKGLAFVVAKTLKDITNPSLILLASKGDSQ